MVKNTHGGSKHKSQARKDTQQSNIQNNIEPNGPRKMGSRYQITVTVVKLLLTMILL